MTTPTQYLPPLGTAGYYGLSAPYDQVIPVGERYTLKSIRTISDYLANNEDVKTTVYGKYNNLNAYPADQAADMTILGLRSDRGAWVYVPLNLVSCYPQTNGVGYQTFNLVFRLQPISVDTDFTDVLSQISQVIQAEFGFPSTGVVVMTSGVVFVAATDAANLEATRATLKSTVTPYVQLQTMAQQLTAQASKITQLENWIAAHP